MTVPGLAIPWPIDSDPYVDANFQAIEAWADGLRTTVETASNVDAPPGTPLLAAPGSLNATTSVEINGQETIIGATFTWGTVTDASSYLFKLTKQGDTDSYVSVVRGAALRLVGLKPNQQYSFTVASIDAWGRAGADATAHVFTTAVDTTPPSQITGVAVTKGVRTLIITWDASSASDFRDYQIDVATDSGFTTIVASEQQNGTFYQFEPSTPPSSLTTYYVRVRAFDVSGNAGTYSATASATLGPASGAQVESLDVVSIVADKITTGTLTAVVTLSGTIKTASSGQRVEIDASGVRAYNSSGVALADLKTSGSPIFSLRTSDTGDRVEFRNDEALRMLLGSDGNEAWSMDTAGLNIQVVDGVTSDYAGIDFFRRGQSDSTAFAELRALWSSTSGIRRVAQLRLQDIGNTGSCDVRLIGFDSTGEDRVYVGGFASGGAWNAAVRAFSSTGQERGVLGVYDTGIVDLFAINAGGTDTSELNLNDVAQASGYSVWLEPVDSCTVRIGEAGLQYVNAFTHTFGGVTAGASTTASVSYGQQFHANSPVPDNLAMQHNADQYHVCRASSLARTGFTLGVFNVSGSNSSGPIIRGFPFAK